MAGATGQPSKNDTAVILERIDSLRDDIAEVKAGMSDVTSWRHEFEKRYEVAHNDIDHKANLAHQRIDEIKLKQEENTAQIKALRDAIQPMIYTNKVLSFIGGTLGVSVIALIWAIMTGQVSLVFP